MTTPEQRAEWLRLCDAATEWKRYLREKKGLVSTMPSESRNFEAIAQCLDALLAENEKLQLELKDAVAEAEQHRAVRVESNNQWRLAYNSLSERLTAVEAERDMLRAALEGLHGAVSHMKVPQTIEDVALQVFVTIGPALENSRAALEQNQ
jgi:regulator of replication initiation timing